MRRCTGWRPTGSRGRAGVAVLAIALASGTAACPVAAAGAVQSEATVEVPPAHRTRVYLGMWSTHLRDLNRGLVSNSLLGVSYRGWFGATFINSFGDRAVTVGMQRNFSFSSDRPVATGLGYRAGFITGYDERFFGIGDKLPALPFVQLLGVVDWRNVGVELGYAGIVASVTLNWRL